MNQSMQPLTPEQMAQHPLLALMIAAYGFLAITILLGGVGIWIWAANRLSRGISILPVLPWRPRVWGLMDLIFVAATLVVSQYFAIVISKRVLGVKLGPGTTEEQLPLSAMALLGMANLATVLICVLWIRHRHQATLAQLGLGWTNLRRNVLIGVVAGVGTLPLIYAIMVAVSQGMDTQYNHPLIKNMLENATIAAYLLGCFSAVIAAPLAEEFFFRVILQGWLQSVGQSLPRAYWFWGASETERERAVIESLTTTPNGVVPSIQTTPESSTILNPYGSVPSEPKESPVIATVVGETDLPLWPVLVSGTLFGVAHLGYGLSYIPLTVMGIVLGLLYRATQSIVPSLLVHVFLNLFSMLALGLAIAMQQAQAAAH